MKVKTAKLTDRQLDWATALALGYTYAGAVGLFGPNEAGKPWCVGRSNNWWLDPTGEWVCGSCLSFPPRYEHEQAVIISMIEENHINLRSQPGCAWVASAFESDSVHARPWFHQHGETVAVAVLRCHVALKLGDEVDIPEELT